MQELLEVLKEVREKGSKRNDLLKRMDELFLIIAPPPQIGEVLLYTLKKVICEYPEKYNYYLTSKGTIKKYEIDPVGCEYFKKEMWGGEFVKEIGEKEVNKALQIYTQNLRKIAEKLDEKNEILERLIEKLNSL